MPESGNIYSVNEANASGFSPGVQNYIQHVKDSKDPAYTSRYVGSLVADFHRTLLKGGIFFYPSTAKSPNGKLRLMYECNPMAFIAEQAGGLASDGRNRILEITPERLHQRVPFFVGSTRQVQEAQEFVARDDT